MREAMSDDDLLSTIETAWWGIKAGKGPAHVQGITAVAYLSLLTELYEARQRLAEREAAKRWRQAAEQRKQSLRELG